MNDLILLSDEEWEYAQNMLDEYLECSCGEPAECECVTCMDDLCGYCVKSHVLGRHEIRRLI